MKELTPEPISGLNIAKNAKQFDWADTFLTWLDTDISKHEQDKVDTNTEFFAYTCCGSV